MSSKKEHASERYVPPRMSKDSNVKDNPKSGMLYCLVL